MSPPAGEPVTPELSDLVFRLAGRLRAAFETAAAEFDLQPVQARVLLRLRPPSPMRDVAAILSCDPSYVTGIVDALEDRGLITRRPDPSDRRVKQLLLTAEGRRLRDRVRIRAQAHAAATMGLSDADQRELRDLLSRALAAPDPFGPATGPC